MAGGFCTGQHNESSIFHNKAPNILMNLFLTDKLNSLEGREKVMNKQKY